MGTVRFGVLGPVTAAIDGTPVPIGGTKQRAVLAALLLRANDVVPSSQLVDDLWADRPPPTATKAVQVYLSRLRRALGPHADLLESRGGSYVLRVDSEQLDLLEAESLCRIARADLEADAVGAAQLFRRAISLWRGPALSDVATEPFAQVSVPRLEELRLSLLDDLASTELTLGKHTQLLPELRQLVAENPLRERLVSHLMLALYRSGRQAEALEELRRLRRRLSAETGLDPSPTLRQLETRILAQDPSLDLAWALQNPQRQSEPGEALPSTSVTRRLHSARPIRPRLSRRRWLLVVASSVVVAVAVMTAGVLWPRNHAVAVGGRAVPDSVLVIDPATGDARADVLVGGDPGAIAVASGSAWVASRDDHTLTRINAQSYRTLATLGLAAAPTSVTASGEDVWVGNDFAGSLTRILVRFGQVSAPFFPGAPMSGLLAVAATPQTLWVGRLDGSLLRVDPSSLQLRATIHMGVRVKAIAVVDGSAWTIPFNSATVQRVDPGSTRATTLARLRGQAQAISAAGGDLWIATVEPDRLWRLDADTGEVVTTTPLAHAPTALGVAAGSVWVAEGLAGTIERIPTAPRAVRAIFDVGHPVGGIAVSPDAVWVTLDAG